MGYIFRFCGWKRILNKTDWKPGKCKAVFCRKKNVSYISFYSKLFFCFKAGSRHQQKQKRVKKDHRKMTVSSLKQRKMIHFSKSFQCWTNKSKVRSCRHCYALITSQDTAYISIKKLLLQTLGDIQQLRGPNFTQFWLSPPSSGQTWTFFIPSTLCHVTHLWTFYWPPL